MPSVDYPADHNKTFDSPAAIDYVHILVYVSLLLRKGPRFLVTSREYLIVMERVESITDRK